MKFALHLRVLAQVFAVVALPIGAVHADTTVFAAASLRGALDEIAALGATPVTLSYAGSGTIARQVSIGAPADVVILAHPRWMDWLETRGAVLAGSRRDIANNSLVVIGPNGAIPLTTPTEIPQRLDQGRLAMGQRDSVPAGIYAQTWLETTGLWDRVMDQLAEVENVRLALALVARGETPLGVVYRSDAQAEPRVDVVYNVPETTHDPITYPAAAITEDGRAFLTLLSSPEAAAIFENNGFTIPEAPQ